MIESILAWVFLIVGIASEEPVLIVASAGFAIAGQICSSRNKDGRGE